MILGVFVKWWFISIAVLLVVFFLIYLKVTREKLFQYLTIIVITLFTIWFIAFVLQQSFG